MASLREELEKIREARGVLTPEAVLDAARDRAHPLHNRFEWDDSVAAEKWRLEQAHELITIVRVQFKDARGRDTSIRAFQAVRTETGHVYQPSEVVAADPVLTQIVLMDMKREWKQLQARYGRFSEFVAMVREDTA